MLSLYASVLYPPTNTYTPLGDGPIFTTSTAQIVLTELGMFSKSSVTLPSFDRRALLAMSPYTLLEIVQDDIGTIGWGYVLNPRQQVTSNDNGTITLELEPLTVECTWRLTQRGWTANNWLSVIANRIGNITPGWQGIYVATVAQDFKVGVVLNNPTVLAGFLDTAKQFGQFARQGVDVNGVPTRTLEMGQFGAPATTYLVSADGGDAEALTSNANIRLITAIDVQPNNVQNLVNNCVPFGGGSGDTLVTLERLWRIIYDPAYPNYGKYGNAPGSVFPEYDPNFPIGSPITGTRTVTLDGHYDYPCYDQTSYQTWGHREAQFIDSSLTYADNSIANQELTARALYVSTITNFKRRAHPHTLISCTTEGRGRPTRAGDLVSIDFQRQSVDERGAIVELNVTQDLKVMSIVRTYQGETAPTDTYVLSNLGRFDDEDGTLAAQQAQQMVALQINQGTSLAPMTIWGSGNADANHPFQIAIDIPRELYRWHRCTFRADFLPYTATSTTATNSAANINLTIPGQSVSVSVPHGAHNLDGTFSGPNGQARTSSDGFSTDLYVHIYGINGGTGATTGSGYYPESASNPAFGRSGNSLEVPVYRRQGANNAGLDANTTATSHTVPIKQGVLTAGTLTGTTNTQSVSAPLPAHTHPLDQRIPDGPAPVNVTLYINGVALPSNELLTGGTRNADGTFSGSFALDDIGPLINLPGQTVVFRLSPGTSGSNPYGVGRFIVGGTLYGEWGGLSSTVRAT